jgi:tripartite-type tricarboxylate transporter receptor subunit TctC
MKIIRPQFLLVLPVLACMAVAPAVHAQPAYPTKTIRIIMPFPPGGATDIQGRILGEKLTPRLGQQVIIDSRPGANGVIGMELAARAPADGYSLVIATSGNWAVHPHLYKLPYDTATDFVHIVLVATTPGVLVVHPTLPVKNVKELIALAKRNPDALAYGSSGLGGFAHISAELFSAMTGTRMTHVPYKGSVQSLVDLMAGHIQLSFNILAPSMPHIKSGRVRALAVTTEKRVAQLPDVPTVAEAGVRGYENATWSGIGAPAGTPQPVIERLSREFTATLKMPDVQERFAANGSIILGSTPGEFREYLQRELAKYGKLVKQAGITAEVR